MLGNLPNLSVVNENTSLPFRCEDPSKAILILFSLIKNKPNQIQ